MSVEKIVNKEYKEVTMIGGLDTSDAQSVDATIQALAHFMKEILKLATGQTFLVNLHAREVIINDTPRQKGQVHGEAGESAGGKNDARK